MELGLFRQTQFAIESGSDQVSKDSILESIEAVDVGSLRVVMTIKTEMALFDVAFRRNILLEEGADETIGKG